MGAFIDDVCERFVSCGDGLAHSLAVVRYFFPTEERIWFARWCGNATRPTFGLLWDVR